MRFSTFAFLLCALFISIPSVFLTGCVVAEEEGAAYAGITPVCDGLRQEEEAFIDAPFDQDEDGYMDREDPNCVSTYSWYSLDCDDSNPDINPLVSYVPCNEVDDDCNPATDDSTDDDDDGFSSCEDCDDNLSTAFPGNEETCFDSIDNDCDEIIDNDCGDNYTGLWFVEEPIQATCYLGSYILDFEQLNIIYNPPDMSVMALSGTIPGSMSGVIEDDFSFVVENIASQPGPGCDQIYRLTGQFSDADHFSGTLEALFQGVLCMNCNNAEFEVTATRAGTQ